VFAVCWFFFHNQDFGIRTVRLPAPSASAEISFEGYVNKIGFGATIVKDIQRVIICLDILANDESFDEEYATKVAAAEFGARVTVPMSAQPEWRQVFSRSMMSCTIILNYIYILNYIILYILYIDYINIDIV
jgi:hypothetical protein